MTVNLSALAGAGQQFFDNSGVILSGGKLYSYAAGTTTPQATYTSASGSTAHTNPIILNSAGRVATGEIWLTAGSNYKFVLYTSTDALIATWDNITGINGTGIATNAVNVQYDPAGTGAVSTTVQAKLRQTVSVMDFGATGNGSTDDTAAIQAALDSGYSLVFPAGTYLCANLTQSVGGQRFFANGTAILKKNANGPIITSSGDGVEFNGLQFWGDAVTPTFTGNNFVSSGNNLRLINCGSRWAYARAVLATGGHVQIIGTSDIYQTANATATGYDIEIGISGTATLYHYISGIYTSQATGGIKLIDTGSAAVVGSQFGKLYINKGTGPSGTNGGSIVGNRINGITTVEVSNATFTSNAFADTVTCSAGISGFSFDGSNLITSGKYVVNSGTQSLIINGIYNDGNYTLSGQNYAFENNIPLLFRKSDNSVGAGTAGQITYSNLNRLNISNFTTAQSINFAQVGAGSITFGVNGATQVQVDSTSLSPFADNTYTLGASSNRWTVVYATTGTINTSDAREKQQGRTLLETEKSVALKIKSSLKAFKWNDAVDKKGDKARWHFGVYAQDIAEAFRSEGLNPDDYGMFCYDEWNEQLEVKEEDGSVVQAHIPAGNRYGVRYEELFAFVLACL